MVAVMVVMGCEVVMVAVVMFEVTDGMVAGMVVAVEAVGSKRSSVKLQDR